MIKYRQYQHLKVSRNLITGSYVEFPTMSFIPHCRNTFAKYTFSMFNKQHGRKFHIEKYIFLMFNKRHGRKFHIANSP